MTKNKTPAQANAKLIKATAELAQATMRVWFAEGRHQVGNGFDYIFLQGRRQRLESAIILPRGLDLHRVFLPERLARKCAT